MRLRFAAAKRLLVPFIGAGVSRLAGAPDWAGFAHKAFDPFIGAQKFSFAGLELLRNYSDRLKLSIASNMQDDVVTISYKEILHPDRTMASKDGRAIYGHIGKLSKIFVTTNYDNWLAQIFGDASVSPADGAEAENNTTSSQVRTRYYLPDDLKPEHLLQDNVVFHLHGCVLEEKRMVVTTRNYLEHYASRISDGHEPRRREG